MMIPTFISKALTDERDDFYWTDIAFIVAVALLIIGVGIGLRDPWPADEPRFAAIARDMVRSGEWFFPRIGGVYYPDKPPVFFWLMASFYKLTGSLRISFLLPSLFASAGVLLLIYDMGRRLWNRGTGLSAAILLLFTLQFTSSAKSAQIDMLLCFWITLSIYGLVRHLLAGPAWVWYYIGFISAGIGVITKGVGFLPLLILLPYWISVISKRDKQARAWNWRWLVGPVLFLMTIALWLLPMLVYVQSSSDAALVAYRDNILFKQTGDRYLNAYTHLKPVGYYFSNVILPMWLPLSLLLFWIVPAWIKAIRAQDQRVILLLAWIVCVLLFFSLSSGKRGVYILSVLPVTTLLAAPYLRATLQKIAAKRLLFITLVLLGSGVLLACLYFTFLHPDKGAELVSTYKITPWPQLISIGIAALIIALIFRVQHSSVAWLGFLCTFWLIYSLWMYPTITDTRSGRAFMQTISKKLSSQQEIAIVGWKEQFLLYIDRPMNHFGFRRNHEQLVPVSNKIAAYPASLEAIHWLAQRPNRVLLISEKRVSKCFNANQGNLAGYSNRESWYLLAKEDINPVCIAKSSAATVRVYDANIGRLVN